MALALIPTTPPLPGATLVADLNANFLALGSSGGSKFRNQMFDVWQRGTAAITVTTSGGYTADGWIVLPTGASVTAQQVANGRTGALSLYALKVTGATSATDVIVKQRIESYLAAALAGKTVTVQAQVTNNTGASITPTLTVKHPTATDNYASTAAETANGSSLQACPNGATTQIAYTFAVSTSAVNGLEIGFDFGNNFSTTGKSVTIAECDIRATPLATVGLNAAPPGPELRLLSAEMALCQRYFSTSYPNGTTPADGVTTVGGNWTGFATLTTNIAANLTYFPVQMRATPTMTYYRAVGSGTAVWNWYNAGTFTAASAVATTGITSSIGFGVNLTVTGVVVGTAYLVNGGWTASAEL